MKIEGCRSCEETGVYMQHNADTLKNIRNLGWYIACLHSANARTHTQATPRRTHNPLHLVEVVRILKIPMLETEDGVVRLHPAFQNRARTHRHTHTQWYTHQRNKHVDANTNHTEHKPTVTPRVRINEPAQFSYMLNNANTLSQDTLACHPPPQPGRGEEHQQTPANALTNFVLVYCE